MAVMRTAAGRGGVTCKAALRVSASCHLAAAMATGGGRRDVRHTPARSRWRKGAWCPPRGAPRPAPPPPSLAPAPPHCPPPPARPPRGGPPRPGPMLRAARSRCRRVWWLPRAAPRPWRPLHMHHTRKHTSTSTGAVTTERHVEEGRRTGLTGALHAHNLLRVPDLHAHAHVPPHREERRTRGRDYQRRRGFEWSGKASPEARPAPRRGPPSRPAAPSTRPPAPRPAAAPPPARRPPTPVAAPTVARGV